MHDVLIDGSAYASDMTEDSAGFIENEEDTVDEEIEVEEQIEQIFG